MSIPTERPQQSIPRVIKPTNTGFNAAVKKDGYQTSLDSHYPSGYDMNQSSKCREILIKMKQLGYTNFNNNMKVVEKYSSQNKLDYAQLMFAELDMIYNGPLMQPAPQ